MEHTNLIANELDERGFKTYIVEISNDMEAIEVFLDSRKVYKTEVLAALDQAFEGIEFNLSSTSRGVLVIE